MQLAWMVDYDRSRGRRYIFLSSLFPVVHNSSSSLVREMKGYRDFVVNLHLTRGSLVDNSTRTDYSTANSRCPFNFSTRRNEESTRTVTHSGERTRKNIVNGEKRRDEPHFVFLVGGSAAGHGGPHAMSCRRFELFQDCCLPIPHHSPRGVMHLNPVTF